MEIDKSIFTKKITPELFSTKDGNKFYYNFRMGSKDKMGVLDYSDKNWNTNMKIAVAKGAVSKVKNEFKLQIEKNSVTFDNLVSKYIKIGKKSDFVELDYYQKYINNFIGNKKIDDITSLDIKEIFDSLNNSDAKLSTLKIVYDFLNGIFSYAIEKKHITYNSVSSINIEMLKENSYVKEVKDKLNEIYNVISIVFKDDPLSLSHFLFLLHGRGKKEILELRWEFINFDNNSFRIDPKKRKFIRLHPTIKDELLKVRKNFGLLYESVIDKENEVLTMRKQSDKINSYIPDFTISNMQSLVRQLQEWQLFGDSYRSTLPNTTPMIQVSKKKNRILGS